MKNLFITVECNDGVYGELVAHQIAEKLHNPEANGHIKIFKQGVQDGVNTQYSGNCIGIYVRDIKSPLAPIMDLIGAINMRSTLAGQKQPPIGPTSRAVDNLGLIPGIRYLFDPTTGASGEFFSLYGHFAIFVKVKQNQSAALRYRVNEMGMCFMPPYGNFKPIIDGIISDYQPKKDHHLINGARYFLHKDGTQTGIFDGLDENGLFRFCCLSGEHITTTKGIHPDYFTGFPTN